jgi:hypothetical protein
LKVYPPKIKEVITNPNFNIFYKLLTLTQDDIKDEVSSRLKEGEELPSPFEYLIFSA